MPHPRRLTAREAAAANEAWLTEHVPPELRAVVRLGALYLLALRTLNVLRKRQHGVREEILALDNSAGRLPPVHAAMLREQAVATYESHVWIWEEIRAWEDWLLECGERYEAARACVRKE